MHYLTTDLVLITVREFAPKRLAISSLRSNYLGKKAVKLNMDSVKFYATLFSQEGFVTGFNKMYLQINYDSPLTKGEQKKPLELIEEYKRSTNTFWNVYIKKEDWNKVKVNLLNA